MVRSYLVSDDVATTNNQQYWVETEEPGWLAIKMLPRYFLTACFLSVLYNENIQKKKDIHIYIYIHTHTVKPSHWSTMRFHVSGSRLTLICIVLHWEETKYNLYSQRRSNQLQWHGTTLQIHNFQKRFHKHGIGELVKHLLTWTPA